MKPSLLDTLSKHQLLLTIAVIAIFLASGAFFTTNIFKNQQAAITAASCYLQAEVDAKGVEKTALEKELASTQDLIDATNKGITDNWSAITTANAEIAKLTPQVISAYEVSKVNDLYTQLQASKAVDALYAQMQTASTSKATAKTTSNTLYAQAQAAYTLATKMLGQANAAKVSKIAATRATYPKLLSAYNTQLAKYNTINTEYKAALTQYNTYSSQYTTLNYQYNTLVSQYKSKYTTAYTTTTTATLQIQYDTKKKLVDGSNLIKDQIATLNTQITNYKTEDATLNKKVADLTSTLATLRTKIAQADNAASIYRGNLCPRTETNPGLAPVPPNIRACTDNIDNDRNGKQDCDDLDCKGTVACQILAREMPTPTNRVICNDDIDNDRDGATDCYDEDCQEAKRLGGEDDFCTGESIGGGGGGVLGCTGAGADNVNPLATVDDGSCVYSNGGTTGTTGTTGTSGQGDGDFDSSICWGKKASGAVDMSVKQCGASPKCCDLISCYDDPVCPERPNVCYKTNPDGSITPTCSNGLGTACCKLDICKDDVVCKYPEISCVPTVNKYQKIYDDGFNQLARDVDSLIAQAEALKQEWEDDPDGYLNTDAYHNIYDQYLSKLRAEARLYNDTSRDLANEINNLIQECVGQRELSRRASELLGEGVLGSMSV